MKWVQPVEQGIPCATCSWITDAQNLPAITIHPDQRLRKTMTGLAVLPKSEAIGALDIVRCFDPAQGCSRKDRLSSCGRTVQANVLIVRCSWIRPGLQF